MPTDAKRDAVRVLAELLRGSSAIAVADYRGLKVSEMQTVRRTLRANGVELHVAKNRLLKIAADEADRADLKPMLDGPTALATISGDEVTLAKALQEAFRPYKVVTVRGGLLGGAAVDAARIIGLAPSRQDLRLTEPILLLDAAFDAEPIAQDLDVGSVQRRQLLEVPYAKLVQLLLHAAIDAADPR